MNATRLPTRILAVDCSPSAGGVALLDGARGVAEWTGSALAPHNRRLLRSIDRCLKEVAWPFERLDGFAAGSGPGSFTGLRIGLTTVKTLAWATGKPFAAISSLDALAAQFAFLTMPGCPLIDARKGEVYYAIYRPDGKGGLTRRTPYLVEAPEGIAAKIEGPIIFCGDGWPLCRQLFSKLLGDWALEAPSPCHAVRAGFIGELARRRFEEQQADDPVACSPLYVRPSEAEIHHPHLASSRS